MNIKEKSTETQEDVDELADYAIPPEFIERIGNSEITVSVKQKSEIICTLQEFYDQLEHKKNGLVNILVDEKDTLEESNNFKNFQNKTDFKATKLRDVNQKDFSREFLTSLKNNHFFNSKVLNSSDLDCVLNNQDYESELFEIVDNFFESLNSVLEKDKKKDEKTKIENTYERVTSVLNSLTPQNFNSKIHQIKGLAIDTEESLKGTVYLIFEKAIEKPEFSVAYAMMCKQLSSLDVLNLEGQSFNFRKLLVDQCQIEFEKTILNKTISGKKYYSLNVMELKKILHNRSIGNIKFIGELFKQNIINCKIIYQCIKHLLLRPDEVNLECSCILLTTVGEILEKKKIDLSLFFKTMQNLTTQQYEINSRLCCMVLEVIDLRSRKWALQGDNAGSKNSDQLQKKNLDLASKLDDMSVLIDHSHSDRKEESKILEDLSRKSASNLSDTNINSPETQAQLTKPDVIQVYLPTEDAVKLQETKNVWKPSWKAILPSDSAEEKSRNFYTKIKSVLNKLTPQKFTTLLNQVRELEINTKERLKGLIDLVFRKAIDEPEFSVVYAVMCKELSSITVATETGSANFRKLLINRCQYEFEKNTFDENVRAQILKDIEECTDLKIKKELQSNFEEKERIIHNRRIGNIRFIGELFKQNMLTCRIMDQCIRHLILQKDEENLECLCQLLITVGEVLEMKKVDLSPYFKKIQNLITQKAKVKSRIRCMLLDVIELRARRWLPRREDCDPKTMNQIQKEFEAEVLQTRISSCLLNTPEENDSDGVETDTTLLVVISNHAFKKLVQNYFEEYLLENGKSIDQAIKTLQNTFPVPLHTRFVYELLDAMLDKSEEYQYKASIILSQMLLRQCVTVKHFNAALEKLFEIFADLIIDVPKLWDYLAKLLVHTVINRPLFLSKLKSMLQPPQESFAVFIAELMSEVFKLQGQQFTSDIWKQNKIKWTDFSDDQIKFEQTMKKCNLDFLINFSTSKNTAQVLIDRLIQYNHVKNEID